MTEPVTLLVPVSGLMEVWHGAQEADPETILRARGDGEHVAIRVERNGDSVAVVHYLASPAGSMNERARQALVMLVGTHMIFTGPVLFAEVDMPEVMTIVAALSKRE